ncbi:MAG: hypothetical protein JNM56_11725 [Planctomycetia bacterium]|nr:hypothetical protein [Planctomycetia bacterium]
MYTSSLLIALAGLTASAQGSDAPSWSTDYVEARKQATEQGKPLAAVFGTGKDGWTKLAKEGSLGKTAGELLSSKYVCVYLDVDTDEGKRIAKLLEVNGKQGIVISDRSVRWMAFHHEGNLSDQNLTTYLQRYADPNHVVVRTDTNPSATTRTSYYQAPGAAPAPQFGTTMPSFRSSSYCPTCR